MWRLERREWLSWQYLDTWMDRVEMSTNIFFYSQKVGHGMAMACPSCGQCPVSTPPSLFVFWIAARRRQEIHLMNHYSDPLNIHLTYSLCKTAWPSHRITELGSLHLHIYLYFSACCMFFCLSRNAKYNKFWSLFHENSLFHPKDHQSATPPFYFQGILQYRNVEIQFDHILSGRRAIRAL